MAGIITNLGSEYLLGCGLNGDPASDLTVFLYTNLPDLTVNSVTSDLTEASGGGYSGQDVSAGLWVIDTVSTIPTATLSDYVTFNFTGELTGSASVYGYGIKNSSGVLIGAENFGTQTPATDGDYIAVLPTLKLKAGTVS